MRAAEGRHSFGPDLSLLRVGAFALTGGPIGSGTRRKPGPLGPYVDGYSARLLDPGYAPLTVTQSLTALGHLGRSMEREELDFDQLDAGAVKAFLAAYVKDRGHLPTASVLPLLDYLRAEGVLAPEPSERLIGDYRRWLLVDRGLAAVTVRGYERLASLFLSERISP
jgi:hypothetical protein